MRIMERPKYKRGRACAQTRAFMLSREGHCHWDRIPDEQHIGLRGGPRFRVVAAHCWGWGCRIDNAGRTFLVAGYFRRFNWTDTAIVTPSWQMTAIRASTFSTLFCTADRLLPEWSRVKPMVNRLTSSEEQCKYNSGKCWGKALPLCVAHWYVGKDKYFKVNNKDDESMRNTDWHKGIVAK